MPTFLLAIPVFAFVFLVAGLIAVYQGWALSILWGWFIVPLGGPHLGIAHAVGLIIIFGLMTSGLKKDEVKEGASKAGHYVVHLLAPLFAILFGYVAKSFV